LSGRLIVSVAPQAGARHRSRDLAWASILLGCDVGFIFKTSANFEAGAVAFSALHPRVHEAFVSTARGDPAVWQNALSVIRNEHLEHRARIGCHRSSAGGVKVHLRTG
jgi:hypothetical protein